MIFNKYTNSAMAMENREKKTCALLETAQCTYTLQRTIKKDYVIKQNEMYTHHHKRIHCNGGKKILKCLF